MSSTKHLKVPYAPKILQPSINGHWKFDTTMGNGIGFLYLIRDNILRRFYLGKKHYRVRKGKNTGKSADWKYYRSSSPLLKELFAERPLEEFEFIVLDEYKTAGGLSYAETWTLCFVEAPTTVDWYNTRIEKVAWNVTEPITEKHKNRLQQAMNMEKFEDIVRS